jgi:hypothetical protein
MEQPAVAQRLESVMNLAVQALDHFPPLAAPDFPETWVILELSFLHFFHAIVSIFLRASSLLKRTFLETFCEKIVMFYLRFLLRIQVSGAPIELVNEVMNALDFSGISQNCLEMLARESRLFDLISSSQVIRKHSGRSPRQARAFFA